MTGEVYYIDGYNLLHFHEPWEILAREDLAAARSKLIETVSRWRSRSGVEVRIVFDGQGRRAETSKEEGGEKGLTVTFASRHASADALIERGVYESVGRGPVIVVSGDHGVTDLCGGMGALCMSPKQFLSVVWEAEKELSTEVEATRRRDGLGALENRLDPKTVGQLKKRYKDTDDRA